MNADRSFDQIIREHVAGDVFGGGEPDSSIGSAFLVAGPYDAVDNQDADQAAQIRANTIDEMIRATSEAFLGLTIGCARCHDHKFDPILQKDYYSLYAVFAGTKHGLATWASPASREVNRSLRQPLSRQRAGTVKAIQELKKTIHDRGQEQLSIIAKAWTRPPVNRRKTVDEFGPVQAKFIRLICEGSDEDPDDRNQFKIDEFEVYSADQPHRNIAAASEGGVARGRARLIEDFVAAYSPNLAIDGQFGERFVADAGVLEIELAKSALLQRVVFSSARIEGRVDTGPFRFVGEYRIEISVNGTEWKTVATSYDRKPPTDAWRDIRMFDAAIDPKERERLNTLQAELQTIDRQLAELRTLPEAWLGRHDADGVDGPFELFLGGSPARRGEVIQPSSVHAIDAIKASFEGIPEAERRRRFALWMTDPMNPLAARVLANRIWQHHFGAGLVRTPNDFGSMGALPTHPDLLDWLASELQRQEWRLKPLHRLIVTSQAYRQSSNNRDAAAAVDADATLLWRFPPRRLSAEEIRDSMLTAAGVLDRRLGGPGFRLYKYARDNVSTYFPLDQHGQETYRRAVYHQNARASVVDLMTDFDQPDCSLSAPRRIPTTTPLQALTMMNHSFTLSISKELASRVRNEVGDHLRDQVARVLKIAYQREPADDELAECMAFAKRNGLVPFNRLILNTSELIHVP